MEWFLDEGNRKTLALLIFFTTFCGIVLFLFATRQGKDVEQFKNSLFLDDENDSKTTHSTK